LTSSADRQWFLSIFGNGVQTDRANVDFAVFRTSIPARLDALPWSRWHWRVVIALGITWILDGLEVTVVGSLGGRLESPDTLGLSAAQVGWSGSSYIAGAVFGALYFGRLADRLGRKRIFLVTLAVYIAATLLSGLSLDFATFAIWRFFTGFGIGGEYAAINSAIDELIPARVRGLVDLAINGSWWIGALLASGLSLLLLNTALFPATIGWRLVFGFGAILSVAILLIRRNVPESPRWLMTRGHGDRAEAEVAKIEAEVAEQRGALPKPARTIDIRVRPPLTWREIFDLLLLRYPKRALLGFSLMVAQAFFYNAIFFTYSLMLTRFYGVPGERVGAYLILFALGNFFGPLTLGWLFDVLGRRVMIAVTYTMSALGLLATGYAFTRGWLTAETQTLCWSAIFFIASPAAASAYLTVSEIFPLEMRAIGISVFFAIGTGAGGFLAPVLFGMLIESQSRQAVFAGYILGAGLMLVAALIALLFGVAAERKPLEDVAEPVSVHRLGQEA
jgi:MFS family permease